MPDPDPRAAVSQRLRPFGTSIFATITARAIETGAVNLGQGMPDFDGPGWIKDAAARAMRDHPNQYVPMPGVPALRRSIADRFAATGFGRAPDPDREVTVTDGCTEALAATMLGLIEPGDEVIAFEPFYDAYPADVAMAGGRLVPVPMRMQPDGSFAFDEGELRAAVGGRTRAIIVNTPHNPTGKVFTRAELEVIADLCRRHDLLAICDEVYDCHVYEGEHVRLASLDGMAERTITLGSFGKMFSLTGWKIGWAVAPGRLTAGIRAAHQFMSFCVAAPLQHAAAEALRTPEAYYTDLRERFARQRDVLAAGLHELGFRFATPAGGYFILADHTPVSGPLGVEGDLAFADHLIDHAGVASIPPSSFYRASDEGRTLIRFAFCVSERTIERALANLRVWRSRTKN